MFENKKTSLYSQAKPTVANSQKSLEEMNVFERYQFEQEHSTVSGNGSYKLDTSGDIFVDDFAGIAGYKTPRDPQMIFGQVEKEWSVDPLKTLQMAAYIRGISRESKVDAEDKVRVIGQGLRHEYLVRMMWIASQNLRNFVENADILTVIGSEKDIFDMWRLQLSYGERIIPEKVFCEIIVRHLAGPSANLVMKYLPTIRPKSKQKTLQFQMNSYIGRKLSDYLWPDLAVDARRASYRRYKTSGTAHQWQQLISQGKYTEIDWKKVSGKALTKLTNSKFVDNHGLTGVFASWVKSQDTIKSTSYPFELLCPPGLSDVQAEVANKQFQTLVDNVKDTTSQFLVTVDISGSMTSTAHGTQYTSYKVAHAMAAFFANALKGPFKDTYAVFSDVPSTRTIGNKTPYQFVQEACENYYGSTNFLGVADLMVQLRRRYPQCSEAEFPGGILCISDGEFNPSGWYNQNCQSNFDRFLDVLREGGFSEEYVKNFKIVLWDIPYRYYGKTKPTFEALADRENFFYMSGFDGSAIQFLTTGEYVPPKTAQELVQTALSQDILQKLKVYC